MKGVPSSSQRTNINKDIWNIKNINNNYEIISYLYSHFITMNKHQQYSYYIDTFGFPEGEDAKVTQE
jgi:hypothetical protein